MPATRSMSITASLKELNELAENKLTKWLYILFSVKWWILGALGGTFLLIGGTWTLVNTPKMRDVVKGFVHFCEEIFPNFTFAQGIVLAVFGLVVIIFAAYEMMQHYISVAYPRGKRSYYRTKVLQKGPKIVVIGGGSGLATILSGLKEYTWNLTAAVSVGDDGGSSGRLREQFGVIPLGDIRNCIVALSDREELTEQLLDYRFTKGEELDGHSLGNLLLLAMCDLKGDYAEAVANINNFLYLRGKVLPIANEPITLCAELEGGAEVCGECNLRAAKEQIKRLKIEPQQIKAVPEVLRAIDEADAIILGPGSLYTSVLPNLLVGGVAAHIKRAQGTVFYINNVMTEPGETDSYQASDHLRAVVDYLGEGVLDYCILNDNFAVAPDVLARYQAEGAEIVRYDKKKLDKMNVKILAADLLESGEVLRHDSKKLAHLVIETIYGDYQYYKRKPLWQRKRKKV